MISNFFKMNVAIISLAILMLSAIAQGQSNKQSPPDKELYSEIARMDSLLFDVFNKHDIARFRTFFTKDLEFYHDKSGLTRYEQNM